MAEYNGIEADEADEQVNDPWANRSSGMRCRTCMFFVRKQTTDIGRCRRHAPTMGGYPVVYPDDWCGDHKLDETKVPAGEPEGRPLIDVL
jgi:hypothetical protein